MKKIIICLLSLFLLQNVCFAAEWLEINSKTYIDKETYIPVSKDFQYTNFWIKSLNNKSNYYLKRQKEYNTTIWYQIEHWSIDCKKRKYSINELLIYDTKGSLIDSYSLETIDWLTIPPETVSESYYKIFCKY